MRTCPANLTLTLEAEPDLPPVAADADKVRQILTNLVDNAVKYSPDGGADPRRGHAATTTFVRFAVIDDGLGIPPAEHHRIFEKFYRLDPELTRGVGGTGLGLYISRELVRRMNGRVDVESTEGRRLDLHGRAADRALTRHRKDARARRRAPSQSTRSRRRLSNGRRAFVDVRACAGRSAERRPTTTRRSSESTRPMMPTINRITPTVWMLTPETVAVTAQVRIAPAAMRRMLTPTPMWVLLRV